MSVLTKWAGWLLITVSINLTAGSKLSEIPLELFSELPYIESPVLSPDGKSIALLIAYDGAYHIAVADFEKLQPKIILKLEKNARRHFNWVDWASNSRLIASYTWLTEKAYLETNQGKDLLYRRLIAVDKDGSNVKPFEYDVKKNIRAAKFSAKKRHYNPFIQDKIIDTLPDDKEHVLLALDGGIDWNVDHVYKLNINSGKYTLVKKNFQNIQYWYTDPNHELRLGIAYDENVKGRYEYHYKNPETSKWEKILQSVLFKDSDVAFMGFDNAGEKLYFSSNRDTDTMSLHAFDLNTRKFSEPLFNHPKVDIENGNTGFNNKQLSHIIYTDDLPKAYYLNERETALQKMLDKALPSRSNVILQTEQGRSIIASQTGAQPLTYFLFDKPKKSLQPWFSSHPDINASLIAQQKSISFKARDGMLLYGYVTLPKTSSKKLPPVVVFPHGGPWARDYAGFDAYAQALASRGYAVLQINFRGSSGYGTRYQVSGYREWGRKMQDDLSDALQWLGKQKLADSSRACIMGISYGGYAALMGVIKSPDQYQCAISLAGVTDLVTLAAQRDSHASFFDQFVGEQGSNEVKETSPAHQAAKIKAPILLMHGERDTDVDVSHTHTMAKKLKKAGKKHKVILFENGDHSLSNQEDRIQFIKESVKFLQKYLPAR